MFRERKKVFFLIKLSYVKELVFLKVICNFVKYINIFFIKVKNQMRSYLTKKIYYWREFMFLINYLFLANFNYFWNVGFMAVCFYVYKQVLYIKKKKRMLGKGKGDRREYMTNIQVHFLKRKDIAINIFDIIAEGKTIDFKIPRIMKNDLIKLGIPIEEIRISSRTNEMSKWIEMLAKWED